MIMSNSPFPTARRRGLVVQQVRNELLVYDLDTDRAHCLNETAAAVWRACDGKRPVAEIAAAAGSEIRQRLNEDAVWLAIDQLAEHRLLEGQIERKFDPISRREAVRRIGMASMAALPVIASLAAPKSVFAAASCACEGQLSCVSQAGCPTYCNQRLNLCTPAP